MIKQLFDNFTLEELKTLKKTLDVLDIVIETQLPEAFTQRINKLLIASTKDLAPAFETFFN